MPCCDVVGRIFADAGSNERHVRLAVEQVGDFVVPLVACRVLIYYGNNVATMQGVRSALWTFSAPPRAVVATTPSVSRA